MVELTEEYHIPKESPLHPQSLGFHNQVFKNTVIFLHHISWLLPLQLILTLYSSKRKEWYNLSCVKVKTSVLQGVFRVSRWVEHLLFRGDQLLGRRGVCVFISVQYVDSRLLSSFCLRVHLSSSQVWNFPNYVSQNVSPLKAYCGYIDGEDPSS